MLNRRGYTLIEVVMVILMVGILFAVATTTFLPQVEKSRFDATLAEMNAIARAITGNDMIHGDGARTDFGYVGDVGSLPPDLDALVTNPGLGTWNGPYLDRDPGDTDFKYDSWDSLYVYSDTLIRSVGSGDNIDKVFAASSQHLLNNSVRGIIRDADLAVPGSAWRDSIYARISYPDGAGSMANDSAGVSVDGYFSFSGIPVGNHSLIVVYAPASDTVTYPVCVLPGRDSKLDIIFPADLW